MPLYILSPDGEKLPLLNGQFETWDVHLVMATLDEYFENALGMYGTVIFGHKYPDDYSINVEPKNVNKGR